jgi:peptide/nickel transport system permease protein
MKTLRKLFGNAKARLGLVLIMLVLLAVVLGPLLSRYEPEQMGAGGSLQQPSGTYLMGTDLFGRDLLVRVLHGGRVSLEIATLVTLAAIICGVLLGVLSGFYGGRLDLLIVRLTDIGFAFPEILMALAIGTILGPGYTTVIIALAIAYTPQVVRVVRATVLEVREQPFVSAARSLGCRDWRIIVRHILPNCAAPVIVQASLILGFAVLAEAGISYLGFGIQPPTPSWGLLLADGRDLIYQAPYLSIFPGIAIALTVIGLNFTGDGLRDVLDPRTVSREAKAKTLARS